METLFDQSRAYAKLGMIDEARVAASEALRMGDMEETLRTWLVILAYKSADFPHAAALGTDSLGRGIKRAHLHDYTALALHHVGRTREAAALLLGLEERCHSFLKSYLIACFLSATGDCDKAVRHLLSGLPDYHDECERTWLDGDLKALWMKLASGDFTLKTAHMLIEREFDVLREWRPGIGTKWNLDPANYSALPDELRAVVRFDPNEEAYVLDYSKTQPGSERAVQFERWARREVHSNQERFECARRIAWERVLDAQRQYALAAWRRGDLCAARHHVMWALENQPERIADYFDLTELGPLIDEMSQMIDSDWNFFAKLRRARELWGDPEAALEILDALPAEWRTHPLLEQVCGICFEKKGRAVEGLACILRACDSTPQDAGPFLIAMAVAMRHGWKDVAAAIHRCAPAAARRYTGWLKTAARLKGSEPEDYLTREFRGQPDLGGQIIEQDIAICARTLAITA